MHNRTPGSVHVCMLHGVDPSTLVEKQSGKFMEELKKNRKDNLPDELMTPELLKMAFEHYMQKRGVGSTG